VALLSSNVYLTHGSLRAVLCSSALRPCSAAPLLPTGTSVIPPQPAPCNAVLQEAVQPPRAVARRPFRAVELEEHMSTGSCGSPHLSVNSVKGNGYAAVSGNMTPPVACMGAGPIPALTSRLLPDRAEGGALSRPLRAQW
jgi:hypothetical protein